MAKLSLSISEFDEFALIRRLNRPVHRGDGFVRGTLGEDAALCPVARGCSPVMTTDMVIEGVHFDRRWMRAEEVGWRLLARGLSDLASVGAQPKYFLVSAALPRHTPVAFIDGVYRGLYRLAKKSGIRIVGGDTAHTRGPIVFDLVAVGEVRPRNYVSRRGARVGDRIYLTGSVGATGFALKKLKQGISRRRLMQTERGIMQKFLYPKPRVKLGPWIARRGATAMIDISDGLLADLGHLLKASGVGARLESEKISHPKEFGLAAFTSGEDYELIFTAPVTTKIRHAEITEIGRITARLGRIELVDARGHSLTLPRVSGYSHFRA